MSEGHLIEAWGDGVCEPVNPGGHAAWGIRICVDRKEVHTAGGYVGEGPKMSNNVAEYAAATAAFDWVGQSELPGILKLRMDSKLVINQLSGKWKVHREYNGLYIPYHDTAKLLLDLLKKKLGGVELIWIPRTENEKCDKYSKQVLRDRGIRFRLQPEAVDK